MSVHHHESGSKFMAFEGARTHRLVDAVVRWAFSKAQYGRLRFELPHGRVFIIDGDRPGPQAQLTIHRWRALRRLIGGWDLGAAEGYMAGDWSSPDLAALLNYACQNASVAVSFKRLRPPKPLIRLRHALNRNTRRGSRRNIVAHYDLGNDFYEQWLDSDMSYSSALYSLETPTLEDAQQAKIDRIVALLDLNGGESILEIGCGWGALAVRLATMDRISLTGITLSTEQLDYARHRLQKTGAAYACDLRLQDYRDVSGSYDRIVSIEMLEAVGEAYWPLFFARLRDLLCDGGVAVLQVITIDEGRFAQYRRRPDFIQRYVFPGGMLPTTGIVVNEAAKAGLKLVSSEFFGGSYGRTLAEWNRRFQCNWSSIHSSQFDDRFKRMWEYYLAYCQAGFDTGVLDVGLYKFSK